jgi:hypothetical protein
MSNYAVRSTEARTGAEHLLVRGTLTELNKEGRKLPAPSQEELAGYIAKEEFTTKYDPELTDKERKKELHQLERAKEEVKQGVKGSHFYAWKNLTKRVRDKMKKILAVTALTGLIAAGAAGCATTNNNGTNTNSEVTQSQQADTQLQQLAGDSMDISNTTVTDEHGEYAPLVARKDGPLYADTSSVWESSVTENGFTADDVKAAQKELAGDFTSYMDSPALASSSNAYTITQSIFKDKLDTTSMTPDYISNPENYSALSINKQYDPILPVPITDGGARWSGVNTKISAVRSLKDTNTGKPYLVFDVQYVGDLRVTDQSAMDSAVVQLGSKQAAVKALKPEAQDGTGENAYNIGGTLQMGFTKNDNSWKITGWNSNYTGSPKYATY